jgi:hypothetical protein
MLALVAHVDEEEQLQAGIAAVTHAQIPPGRYIEIITAAALSALGAPATPPASHKNTEGVKYL